ncbi:hypothetical protein [Sphingomonas colocasiae]|uniref:Lipoprotein n=1 Tax=Sphingomonas colocasiae TaxID=1848973 RepID=A0ABS7PKY2_9SPHN|nr:hypothetical protein [Sphingomonas colocasiae]MBY8821946.1 hypothetical protein [Sphingomonas colocasiae]
MKRHSPTRLSVPAALLLAISVLAGCSADIMRGYVGRPPEAVMARYGPPVDVRDLPGGRRAYQWLEESTVTAFGATTTTVEEKGRRRPRQEITTEFAPSTTETQRCFYTFYARRAAEGWLIDGFEKPASGC